MCESLTGFDKQVFADQAISAYGENRLLNWLVDSHYDRCHGQYQEICIALVDLANSGQIDLIGTACSDQLRDISNTDFWLLQDLYVSVIPQINTNPNRLIEAVIALVDRGGNDFMANRPNEALRDWLKERPNETRRLLEKAKSRPEAKFSYLTFVLEAGAIHNLAEYHDAAIGFLSAIAVESRLAAITALSRIDASAHAEIHIKGLDALSKHVMEHSAENEAAAAITALLGLYALSPALELERIVASIKAASEQPTPELHFLLAQSLGQHCQNLPIELQVEIIQVLRKVDPSSKEVVDQIDYAFSRCLCVENREKIADCLEDLLDRSDNPLKLADLNSLTGSLMSRHSGTLSWLILRWLRHGSQRVRLNLPILIRYCPTGDLTYSPEDYGFSDEELIFISRKAIGYFVIQAEMAASIIIACLKVTKSKHIAEAISNLLFDPLMINFSGLAREVVECRVKTSGPEKNYLRSALKRHDEYLAGLKSIGNIPELRPSPSEQQVQAERQRQKFAKSFQDAEKSSVLMNLVSRQTLLHGVGSVRYVRAPDGELHRSESLLSQYATSMEYPRLESIDPVWFQKLLLEYRSEEFNG